MLTAQVLHQELSQTVKYKGKITSALIGKDIDTMVEIAHGGISIE